MDGMDEWRLLAIYQAIKRRSPSLAKLALRCLRMLNSFQKKIDRRDVSE